MFLRDLQDRATGRRRVRVGGGGGESASDDGANDGVDLPKSPSQTTTTPASPLSSPLPTTTTTTTPARLASSLAASADLAPRLRVVATCDGHEGCVNAVSFAGQQAERLVTGKKKRSFAPSASRLSPLSLRFCCMLHFTY